jgi:pimeloyl-ACP methyl ester carboxylesterase
VKLRARRFGAPSSPPALLVQGATDSSSTWWRVGPWLSEQGFDVIAVDLRGHGRSADDGKWGGDVFTRAALDLVETIGELRPDTRSVDLLVAHSLGTVVALTCVAEHPWFAERLVLEEPPGVSMPFDELKVRIPDTIGAARANPKALIERLRGQGLDDVEVENRVVGLAAADADYVRALIGALAELDAERLAERCPLPTLLVVGRDAGGPLNASDGRQLADCSHLSGPDRAGFLAALPDVTLVELDGGHNLHQPLFDAYISALAGWLATQGESNAS